MGCFENADYAMSIAENAKIRLCESHRNNKCEITLSINDMGNRDKNLDGHDLRRFVQTMKNGLNALNAQQVSSYAGMNGVEALFPSLRRYISQIKAIPANTLGRWVSNAQILLNRAPAERAETLLNDLASVSEDGKLLLATSALEPRPEFDFPLSKDIAEKAKQRATMMRNIVLNIMQQTDSQLRKIERNSSNHTQYLAHLAEDTYLEELGALDFADATTFDTIFLKLQSLEETANDLRIEDSELQERIVILGFQIEKLRKEVETFEVDVRVVALSLNAMSPLSGAIQWHIHINERSAFIKEQLKQLADEISCLPIKSERLLKNIESLDGRVKFRTEQMNYILETFIGISNNNKETRDEL
jgi:hypothetical protein